MTGNDYSSSVCALGTVSRFLSKEEVRKRANENRKSDRCCSSDAANVVSMHKTTLEKRAVAIGRRCDEMQR